MLTSSGVIWRAPACFAKFCFLSYLHPHASCAPRADAATCAFPCLVIRFLSLGRTWRRAPLNVTHLGGSRYQRTPSAVWLAASE